MNNIVRSLKENMQRTLDYINVLEREARNKGFANEQWFLDWQDELNSISVR